MQKADVVSTSASGLEQFLPMRTSVEIGIHGVPVGMDHWIGEGNDWTLGCIALCNADLDCIYPAIKPRVTILEVLP